MTGFKWTPELDLILKEHFYKEGWEVLKNTGLSRRTIQRRAAKIGLKTQQEEKRDQNRNCLKDDYFTLWNPLMAYDLGFGFADGNVFIDTKGRTTPKKRYKLKIQRGDEILLEDFKERINSSHIISRGSQREKTGNLSHWSQIQIYSRTLVESLIDIHGMVPNKSHYDLDFPKIPEELIPDFIRGYFDGDGTASRQGNQRHFGLLGQPKFIEAFREIIATKLGISKPKISKDGNIVRITWAANVEVDKIVRYLYPVEVMGYLERKFQILHGS